MKIISESTTNCIEKEILTHGIFSVEKPTESSKCKIKIDSLNFSTPSIDANTLRSEYLSPIFQEDIEIIVGDAKSEVDECVERIIGTMFVGEKSSARLTLKNGNESNVLIDFKITLTDYESVKPIWEWRVKEKYNLALKYKEIGVGLHKSMRIVEAFKKFSRACKILITLEPLEDHRNEMAEEEESLTMDIENLRKVLYNNMAECHLIRKNYELAILLCDKVLKRDENNVKAIYRRAIAHENLKDYEKALEHMDKVLLLEPRNTSAKERSNFYRQKVSEAKKRYDNIVKKMFNV